MHYITELTNVYWYQHNRCNKIFAYNTNIWYHDEEVINMNKEYLDLIYENEGEEEVKNAILFEDEWIDINEEAWEL